MINIVQNNVVRFIGVVLFQLLILNNVNLGGFINPNYYVVFVLLLPIEMSGLLALALGFFLGLTIDVFTGTIGMHASATVFLAFCRVYILRIMAPREGYDFGATTRLHDQGIVRFISFTSILVILHALFLFYVEAFRFQEFFAIMSRAILSSIVTIALIVLGQYLISPKKAKA